MKRTLLLPALFILFTLSCRKSNSPTNTLPPETHSGAMTMGCYVDNKLFIPQEPGLDPGSIAVASIQTVPSAYLSTSWIDNINPTNNTSISIKLDSIQLMQGATYTLGAPPDSFNQISHAQWATYIGFAGLYYTAGQGSGQVTIDYYDPTVSVSTGIVSGHFSFDAVDLVGDTVHITEGRFDMAAEITP